MSDTKFESSGQSQMRAVGKVDGNAYFGDTYQSNGPREITVSDVGGTPPNFDRYWVDRTSYQSLLTDRISIFPVTEIVAVGGFGKSSLAAWGYANLRGGFQKRLWVSFGQPKTFDRVARWILQEVGFPNKDPEVKNDGLLRELIYRLNEPNTPVKTLVVLDQLETIVEADDRQWFERFLMQWAENGQESRVLVTTRSPFLSQEPIVLGGLNQDEGATFLGREGLTGDRFSALVDLTKGHPLLLKLAASWTKETYESQVDDRAIDFFTKLFANYKGDPRDGVAAIFDVIFGALPPALQTLLCGLSVYRLPIDIAMAQAMQPHIKVLQEETLKNFNIDLQNTFLEATKTALQSLCDWGLLLSQDDRFVLHPLVAGLVRSRVTDEVRRDAHERAIVFYEANYQEWDGTIESCRSELESFYHACELGQYDRASGILDRCYKLLHRDGKCLLLLPMYEDLTRAWDPVDDAEAFNLGEAWTRSGNLHGDLSNYQSAIANHHQAQEIFDRLDSPQGKAAALGNLGLAYRLLGNYDKAIECHSQNYEIAKAIGDKSSLAMSLGNLGLVYDSLGDYQKAIECHSQNYELAKAIGNNRSVAISLGNLGNAYQAIDNYQKAVECHSQNYELAREIGDKRSIAISLGNLGLAYYSLGSHQKAIEYHSHALELKQENSDKYGMAISLGNLGLVYDALGNYQKAFECHSKDYDLAKEIGHKRGVANSLFNMAKVQEQLDDHFNALQNFQKSKDIYEELNLNNEIEKCNRAIRNCTQTIAAQRRTPPPLDDSPPPESTIDWYEKQRQLNQPKTHTAAELSAMNRKFFLWFCVGITIVLLIGWLKR